MNLFLTNYEMALSLKKTNQPTNKQQNPTLHTQAPKPPPKPANQTNAFTTFLL